MWRSAALVVIGCASIAIASGAQLSGTVTDKTGAPISGALLISSGGFNGWATTASDGSFHIAALGTWISVRHADYGPVLMRSSDLSDPAKIELDPAGSSVYRMPACSVSGPQAVGGGLRITPGTFVVEGPSNGEHDSHWYIRIQEKILHIVDGYAWHSGLPLEGTMSGSKAIVVREWTFESLVGLDISGENSDGTRWRWIGAPIAAAIEYEKVPPAVAIQFDKILESACFQKLELPQ